MTHASVCDDAIICDMTHLYLRHDSKRMYLACDAMRGNTPLESPVELRTCLLTPPRYINMNIYIYVEVYFYLIVHVFLFPSIYTFKYVCMYVSGVELCIYLLPLPILISIYMYIYMCVCMCVRGDAMCACFSRV